MTNPYVSYYVNQAGSGITSFSGPRFQKGHGFFGRLFSSTILPALKFLGRKALTTGIDIAQDTLQGQSLRNSMRNRLPSAGLDVAEHGLQSIRNRIQSGRGEKRVQRATNAAKSQKDLNTLYSLKINNINGI